MSDKLKAVLTWAEKVEATIRIVVPAIRDINSIWK